MPTAHERAVDRLRNMIRQGRWETGAKLPTEEMLAGELNVSRGTIRKTLDILGGQGVIKTLHGESGKTRARYVADPRAQSGLMCRTFLLLTDEEAVADDPMTILSGHGEHAVGASIVKSACKQGMNFMHVNSAMLDARDIESLLSQMYAGILVEHTTALSELGGVIASRMAEGGAPVIVGGRDDRVVEADYDCVYSDHEQGGYMLSRWLIERGCKRILQTGISPHETHWVKSRSAGYERAMSEAGLPVLPRIRLAVEPIGFNEATEEEWDRAVRYVLGFLFEYLVGSSRVDAIMAQNDPDALLILGAIRLAGRQPNVDIPVVGYDDIAADLGCRWESLRPLATVDKNNVMVGQEMLALLQRRMEGLEEKSPVVRAISPKLVVYTDRQNT